MAEAEYKTLIQCTQKLRTAIQGDLINISDQLLAAGLITPDTSSELRNKLLPESERATKLVALIISKVQLNPSHNPLYYNAILQILKETYSRL